MKDNILELNMHSIILMVGPSGSGKSTLIENNIIPGIKKFGDDISIHHVSSDSIRRELIGDDTISKSDPRMLSVSGQAFDLLDAKVKVLTSYPVNSNFVIVDSTGLNDKFRNSIKQIAKDNNYSLTVVMFDYKGRAPYTEFLTGEESKRTTLTQLDHMRKNVMRDVCKKNYKHIFKVSNRNFNEISINVNGYDLIKECELSPEFDYVTIGDIHGCYDELISLLEKNGFEINDGVLSHEDTTKRIISLGDIVDKGYDTKGVIEFIHKNIDWFLFVKGNHENFVYKMLRNLDSEDDFSILAKDMPSEEFMGTYFDSVKTFFVDNDLKDKFFDIFDRMKPFLSLGSTMIITHAPCKVKYLGKVDSGSLKNQLTVVYPKDKEFKTPQDYAKAKFDFFKYVFDESSRAHPVHLFGHVSSRGVGRNSNKINLDSGCASGGQLSSIIINQFGRDVTKKASSFDNDKVTNKKLMPFFFQPPRKVSIDTLEGKEKGRLLNSAENGINYVSGTVAPANKILVRDENKEIVLESSSLESIDQAITYYHRKGVNKIIAQCKYMGSRATIYLFKDSSKNYTTSRRGYRIKNTFINLTEAYKPLYDIPFIKDAFDNEDTELLILDSELLPWNINGKKLIEREFLTMQEGMTSESDFLKENGFQESLDFTVNGKYSDIGFEEMSYKTPKKDIIKTLGSSVESTFRAIRNYIRETGSIDQEREGIDIYSEQMELYASDGEAYFKPFSILKQVFCDGTETLFFDDTNEFVYSSVNDDEYCVVDLNSEKEIAILKLFYKKTTEDEKKEGIMIKPYDVYVEDVAPAIKVRNERYLTIVYGADYKNELKLHKLITRKRIDRKVKLSISEWEIGKRMLEIPYNSISKENEHYIQALSEMILEERKEREIDPRL